jgi:hypothetical protein
VAAVEHAAFVAGNRLAFLHAAEFAQGVAAPARTTFVLPALADPDARAKRQRPFWIEDAAETAPAFAFTDHHAAA